jgi:hypothetical protein
LPNALVRLGYLLTIWLSSRDLCSDAVVVQSDQTSSRFFVQMSSAIDH